jgi:hypothetical protein
MQPGGLDLFLLFGSAVLVAAMGLWLLRQLQTRALLIRVPVEWAAERPTLPRLGGAALFGNVGVYLFLRRDQPEPEPPIDAPVAYSELVAGG